MIVKNEAGKTYGYWEVIEFYDIKGKNARWLCKCKNCNGLYPVFGSNLRQGISRHCVRCNHKGLEGGIALNDSV